MLVRPIRKILSINNKQEGVIMGHPNHKQATQNAKKKAVNRVLTLHNNGTSLSNARMIVAGELGVTQATVANWQNSMKKNIKTVRTNHTLGTTPDVPSFDSIDTIARKMLFTLIDQDIDKLNLTLKRELSKLKNNL